MDQKRVIGIAGNIGVGKSTLVAKLQEAGYGRAFPEPVKENPHLGRFYQNLPRWAFASQMEFLRRRADLMAAVADFIQDTGNEGWALVDRTIFEDFLFAQNLFLLGYMGPDEWQTYHDWYAFVIRRTCDIDLIVYLQASVDTLLARHLSRGREVDADLDPDYLAELNARYEMWSEQMALKRHVLVVPYDDLNVVTQPADLKHVVARIQTRLSGLEVVSFNPA